jgi:hypothetical protein
MKKIVSGMIISGLSFLSPANSYDVQSQFNVKYNLDDELEGTIILFVEDGKSSSFSNERVQEFKVNVTEHDNNKVLLSFVFDSEGYKTNSEAVLDLGKEFEFIFGQQAFKFIINKSGS